MTITLQAVNELIQSLESAGELSIREQKFLKLAKEFSICSASLDAAIKTGNMLADQNAQLAAENVAMKQIIDSVTNLDNEPQYHDEGMGCGLEDRGITDRYDACRYGWDEAMERIYGEVIPCADELDFSATDAYLAGIKAEGVEEFVRRLQQCVDEGDFVGDEVAVIVGAIDCGKEFFEQLREGAK
ncbi:hypothetical protein [Klebsiella variicola]|uniref:hypothetical protein n=1 Tax=Klebsiella variicola TaxID=244366 RepID=UPI001E61F7C7|nr:hypothetical protein [Klebsiella variicola]MCE0392409.1 hypothetical protein [Klebsiella variicola subsp. variicola]